MHDDATAPAMLPADRTLPAETADRFFLPGAEGNPIAVYAWRWWPNRAPALLFGHANGFSAGCYAPLLEKLAERYRLFAFDARGHGASLAPDPARAGAYAMTAFGADLQAIAAGLRARLPADLPLHYAAHSLGGIAAIASGALAQPGLPFASMTLFEPPAYPPTDHPDRRQTEAHCRLFVDWAARRRERFGSVGEFLADAGKNRSFARFRPDMLEALARGALRADETSGVRLRCAGAVESAIYASCPDFDPVPGCRHLEMPVLYFNSDPAVAEGRAWMPGIARMMLAEMPRGEHRIMTGCRHLMVQEEPERCLEAIAEQVAAAR